MRLPWHYDDESHNQKLLGLIALCKPCHETKHIGLAEKRGRRTIVKNHLMAVNHWTDEEAESYIQQAFREWRNRSLHEWTLDISWLETQGIQLQKPKKSKEEDIPPIIEACAAKNIKKVKSLIEEISGSDLKRSIYYPANKKKRSPLHNAVLDDDISFLEELLNIPKLLAYINATDNYRETPVFYAVINKKILMLKLLYAYGADIKTINSHKRTLMHFALNNKEIETVRFLLEMGGDTLCHQYDNWDKLPFHSLCKIDIEESAAIDRVEALCDLIVPYLNNDEITKIDKYKRTLLHYAVSVLSEVHIQFLFENGADQILYTVDNYGKTVLHQAAKWGNIAALNLILSNTEQVLINLLDDSGKSALHDAAIYRRKETIQILLAHGAEFETKSTSGGLTAFQEAINKLGVLEAFDLFSPYMQMSEEEKAVYLNQLLLEEQKNPPTKNSTFYYGKPSTIKRARPNELEDNSLTKRKKLNIPEPKQPSTIEIEPLEDSILLPRNIPQPPSGSTRQTKGKFASSSLEKAKGLILSNHSNPLNTLPSPNFGNSYNFFSPRAITPITPNFSNVDKSFAAIRQNSSLQKGNSTAAQELRPKNKPTFFKNKLRILPNTYLCQYTLNVHSKNIYALAVFEDDRMISASLDNTLKILDFNQSPGFECMRILSGHSAQVLTVMRLH